MYIAYLSVYLLDTASLHEYFSWGVDLNMQTDNGKILLQIHGNQVKDQT